LGDLKAAVDWAKQRPGVKADRVGVTGWCWGGSTTIQVAATNPDMKAAVAWYGPPGRPYQSPAGPVTGFDVAKDIKIPLLLLFGEKDTNPPPADGQKLIELIKPSNPNVEVIVYPEAGHGFHADYRPSYNAKAATDAWKRCTAWFDRYLKS
jgi:carboxymethylenebutenolidase